eukprot:1138386-Pelagomonas_calceolata.AAC.5
MQARQQGACGHSGTEWHACNSQDTLKHGQVAHGQVSWGAMQPFDVGTKGHTVQIVQWEHRALILMPSNQGKQQQPWKGNMCN